MSRMEIRHAASPKKRWAQCSFGGISMPTGLACVVHRMPCVRAADVARVYTICRTRVHHVML